MKKTSLTLTLCLALSLLSFQLSSQILQSCDQWANTTVNGYNVYNNIWGGGGGSQCITVNSQSNWYVDANHSGGGIKSYPNVERQLSVNVDNMGAITSAFSVTRPSGGAYASTYDIWYNNYAYEIMLWMNYNGEIGPISYNYGCSGNPATACPEFTNVSIGGHIWNVYRGSNGSNQVFSFIRTSNTNSGTVNITAISQWLRNNGWFGNVNLHSIQFGFEITSTSGTQRYAVTNFNANISTGGGGGGGGGGESYVQFRNRGTGLYLDGMGRSGNGEAAGQWANTTHPNSQWQLISQGGNYYQLRNRGTGLYLDGMGRTGNGDDCGQWANTSHNNSHWEMTQYSGNYYRLRNRGTGLYLDGMGRTSNGSNCGQWANTTHPNSQWERVSVSSRMGEGSEELKESSALNVYPNPVRDFLKIDSQYGEPGTLKVFDVSGRLMFVSEFSETSNSINLSELQSGIYLIEVSTQTENVRSKLVKQ